MNWLHYLAEANIYLGVFYVAYCVFLMKETHYQFNRAYLLFGCLAAFILPLLQLGFLKPETFLTATTITGEVAEPAFSWQDALLYAYLTGVLVSAVLFIIKLYKLIKMIDPAQVTIINGHKLVYLEGMDTAFSFFNYLFIGTETTQRALITRHELVHIRQKHSFDIIFMELLKIVNWCSPMVYLLRNSLRTVHEYIADERTAFNTIDATAYSQFLVNSAYGVNGPSITHSFFNYNLLKKRIIMLHQKRSGSLARLKYLVIIPLCGGLLCESTLGFSKTYGWVTIAPRKASYSIIHSDTTIKKLPPPPAPPLKGKLTVPPKITNVRLSAPPPPPPAKPLKVKKGTPPKVADIRIDEPVPANKQAATEIRIDEPVPANKQAVKEIQIEDAKAPKPNVKEVRFPPPVVRPEKTAKVPEVTLIPPPPPKKAKVQVKTVKFPPPVVKPNK